MDGLLRIVGSTMYIMMTWKFFRVVLHSIKVIQNFMVIKIYLNNFFEICCWNDISVFKILEKKSVKVCYEFSFSRRRRGEGDDDHSIKINNMCQIFSIFLKTENIISAKNFKEFVKIKCDNHKILYNFCEMKNYSEECPRHHTYHISRLR